MRWASATRLADKLQQQLFERIDVHTGRQAVIWAVRNRPEWFASTLLRVIPDSRRGALEL